MEGPQWGCSECTFLNHPALDRCEECEMPRLPPQLASAPTTASSGGVRPGDDPCFCHQENGEASHRATNYTDQNTINLEWNTTNMDRKAANSDRNTTNVDRTTTNVDRTTTNVDRNTANAERRSSGGFFSHLRRRHHRDIRLRFTPTRSSSAETASSPAGSTIGQPPTLGSASGGASSSP